MLQDDGEEQEDDGEEDIGEEVGTDNTAADDDSDPIVARLQGMQLDQASVQLLKQQLYGHSDYMGHAPPKLTKTAQHKLATEPCKPLDSFQARLSSHTSAHTHVSFHHNGHVCIGILKSSTVFALIMYTIISKLLAQIHAMP